MTLLVMHADLTHSEQVEGRSGRKLFAGCLMARGRVFCGFGPVTPSVMEFPDVLGILTASVENEKSLDMLLMS